MLFFLSCKLMEFMHIFAMLTDVFSLYRRFSGGCIRHKTALYS